MMNMADLKSGDLIYWRGTGFIAWLIRWWTRPNFWNVFGQSAYSHVGIVWKNGSLYQFMDAHSKYGVRLICLVNEPPDFAQHTHTAWYMDRFQAVIAPAIGRPYSYGTSILTVFNLAGNGSRSFMCSEFCQWCLGIMGWDWKGKKYHPRGLAEAITRANPEFTVEPFEV